MRVALVGAVVAMLVLARGGAADEVTAVCLELHCYCDGPGEPDTVASCDTTCEAVCSPSAKVARRLRLARWSRTSQVGPSYTSNDAGGSATPAGGSLGVALEGRFGRPLAGILVRLALTSTPIVGAAAGLAQERALVFDWFDVGLELSPQVAHGRRWSVRPTAAVWVASTALLGCGGCDDVARRLGTDDSYTDWGWAARLGVDTYLGASKRLGVDVAIVYSAMQVGDLDKYTVLANNATEHVAPTWMVQLGVTGMPGGP
ncbi:MAG: hypothetical protein JNK64_34290 [Myxococcales bacterium]|nr:hypothetical protein [Myxococcales bacterium]